MKKGTRRTRKVNKKRFIIFGIIMLILIIIIIIVNAKKHKNAQNDISEENNKGITLYDTNLSEYVKETEDGIKLNTSPLINSDKILDNLTITKIQLTYNSGTTSLIANVTNNSNIETTITTINAMLVDESGKELCKVKGVVRALGIGETGKLNISVSGNFVTAYNVKFSK